MSLFRCGFTVQKKKVTERPNNSDASEEIQPAVRSTFQAKKVLPWAMSNSCRGIVRCELGESSLDWRFLGYLAARKRGKYQHYSAEKRAKIGKYASENGNSKAINHFKEELPTLRESTVRTFKQAYQKRLREEKKKGNTDVTVIATLSDTRGRPSILRELDSKIISLLKSIRSSGEVINFCVVKEKALALVDSNKTPFLREFEPTVTWVKSIYRRCNFTSRAGTTTRPPVPRGMFEECKLTFLTDINKMITENKIPPELVFCGSNSLLVGTFPSGEWVEEEWRWLQEMHRQFQLKVCLIRETSLSPLLSLYQENSYQSGPLWY